MLVHSCSTAASRSPATRGSLSSCSRGHQRRVSPSSLAVTLSRGCDAFNESTSSAARRQEACFRYRLRTSLTSALRSNVVFSSIASNVSGSMSAQDGAWPSDLSTSRTRCHVAHCGSRRGLQKCESAAAARSYVHQPDLSYGRLLRALGADAGILERSNTTVPWCPYHRSMSCRADSKRACSMDVRLPVFGSGWSSESQSQKTPTSLKPGRPSGAGARYFVHSTSSTAAIAFSCSPVGSACSVRTQQADTATMGTRPSKLGEVSMFEAFAWMARSAGTGMKARSGSSCRRGTTADSFATATR